MISDPLSYFSSKYFKPQKPHGKFSSSCSFPLSLMRTGSSASLDDRAVACYLQSHVLTFFFPCLLLFSLLLPQNNYKTLKCGVLVFPSLSGQFLWTCLLRKMMSFCTVIEPWTNRSIGKFCRELTDRPREVSGAVAICCYYPPYLIQAQDAFDFFEGLSKKSSCGLIGGFFSALSLRFLKYFIISSIFSCSSFLSSTFISIFSLSFGSFDDVFSIFHLLQ